MLTSVVIALLAAPGFTAWHWDHPRPQGNTLNGGAADQATVVLVGDQGVVVRSTDGARTFTSALVVPDVELRGVWLGGRLAIAVGTRGPFRSAGTILRSTDAGETWSRQDIEDHGLYGIWAASPAEITIVGSEGTVLRSTDQGQSWEPQPTGITDHFFGIGGRGKDVYATGGGLTPQLWRKTATGWARLKTSATNNLFGACVTPKGRAVIVGVGGELLTGPPFKAQKSGTERNLYGAWCPDESTVWTAGEDGFRVGVDGHWVTVSTGGELNGLIALGADTVLGFGKGGLIERLTPSTRKVEHVSGEQPALLSVFGAGGEIYAVGYGGQLLRGTMHNGRPERWALLKTGVDDELVAVWGTSAADVWVLAAFGTLLHTQDGGDTWKTTKVEPDGRAAALWGPSASELYVAGVSGFLARSTDAGQTWTRLEIGTDDHLEGLWGNGKPGDLWVVGGSGAMLHTSDGGKTFSRSQRWPPKAGVASRSFRSIWGDREGRLYVAGYSDDALFVSRDQGRSWAGAKPPGEGHFRTVCGVGTEVFALRDWGVVVRSGDAGKTWQLEPSPAVGGLNALFCDSALGLLGVGHQGAVVHRAL